MNQRQFSTNTVSPIHGPFVPAEIREGEMIKAKVKSLDPEFFFHQEMRVWRISPLGIELVVGEGQHLKKGAHLALDIQIGFQKTSLDGLVVDELSEEDEHTVLHIRLVPPKTEKSSLIERRTSNRWLCSDQFFPTAVAANPVKFNDFIYFQIKDISFGGFKIQTSLRNKFIIPGLAFDCIVNFPMIAQVNMKLTVRHVRVELENGRESLSLGVTYDTRTKKLLDTIGSYLIQFGSVQSLADVQDSGFLVHNVSDAVSYSFVKTKEEFEEVLKLRFTAYTAAGKVSSDKTHLDMTDHFDAKSRIVIGRYRGEIVCSARLIFHQVGEQMEQEKFVKWDLSLPRPDEVVEIMRACTRPDFRGSDLLIGMFKFMAVTVAQAKKNWIVICATDEMVPFYEQIGFRTVNLSYPHTGLNNVIHHVMIANFLDGMIGKTVGPIPWNLVWADSVSYLSHYEIIEVDPFTQMRLTIYKWFAPLARFLYERKIHARIRKAKRKSKPQAEIAVGNELKAN